MVTLFKFFFVDIFFEWMINMESKLQNNIINIKLIKRKYPYYNSFDNQELKK